MRLIPIICAEFVPPRVESNLALTQQGQIHFPARLHELQLIKAFVELWLFDCKYVLIIEAYY